VNVYCPQCNARASLSPERWACACGGAWEPIERSDFDAALIDVGDTSVWRYVRLLGLDLEAPTVRLGEGWTPLVPLCFQGRSVLFKLEFLAPTGSFKDRGTAVMINVLAQQGVTQVADDSSGNSGASVAAYAARAGMRAQLFVPTYASAAKRAQIAAYGADVRLVPGPRANAKLAALEAVGCGVVLASHVYHPAFVLGQQTLAWELWEQMQQRAPDWYVVPIGQGVHLVSVWLGFRRLLAAGLIDHLPRLVGVQASRVAPVYHAFEAGSSAVSAVSQSLPSVAEGLAIAEPVRGARVLQAVRESGGSCIAVDDPAILAAQGQLARQGLFVEPTSATVVAALGSVLQQAGPEDTIVVPLTGSGLKGSPLRS
jgi:threonine synthase